MESILFDIDELCEYIHMKKNTIYDMVHHKRIPYVKIGRCLRFSKNQINEWLKTCVKVSSSSKFCYNTPSLARGEEVLK